ncbi:MAG: hypothetical protein AAGF67_09420 [Verrucomicrobiota bacterium]
MKHDVLFRSILLALAFAGLFQSQQSCFAEPNPEIVSRLEQILEIRKQELQEELLKDRLGRSDHEDMASFQIAVAEAKMMLNLELEEFDEAVNRLKEIVEIHRTLIDRLEALSESDMVTQASIASHRIALLEAEIKLLRIEAK